MFRKLLLSFIGLLLIPVYLFSAGYGKISGKVVDASTGEPLIGATIQVDGTLMGAATNVNGTYVILNVPAGAYTLKCSQVGYQTYTIRNVRVQSDQTTTIDYKLNSQAVQVEAIDVVAERPMVQKNTTSTVSSVTAEEIKNLPTRDVGGIALMSTGVIQSNAGNDRNGIVIRGGRPDEVAFYVDGVQATDRLNGGQGTYIIANAVEEIQVMSGGYAAEYGGANSGIIKSTVKSGTSKYKGSMELRTDSWAKVGEEILNTYSYGRNDYSLQLGGPILPDDQKYRFFVAGQYLSFTNTPNWRPELKIDNLVDDNLNPLTNTHDTIDVYWPERSGGFNWFRYQMRFNGNIVLDLKPFQIRIGGTHRYVNSNNGRGIGNIFNGDRVAKTESYDQTANLKITHFLTPTTFYNLNFNVYNQFGTDYDKDLGSDFAAYGDSLLTANYGYTMRNLGGQWQDPVQYQIWDWGFNRPGTRPQRFNKYGSSYIGGSFDITHQIGITHEIKAGGDFQRYTYRNYVLQLGTLAQFRSAPDMDLNTIYYSQRPNNYGYDFWGNKLDEGINGARHPVFAAAFIQDKIEFSDIVLNLGLRFDHIESDGIKFKDSYTIATDASGLIREDQMEKTPAYNYLCPRVGFSFALTDRTIFFAQWGKFVQQSKLVDSYAGLPWTSRQIAGGNAYPTGVGFDLKPERTIQYDIGFKQQIGENLGFDISVYYKDIKDLVTMAPIQSSQGTYYALDNSDFATTKGIEFKLNLRRTNRLAAQFAYTYSDARGTGSGTQYSTRYYIVWQAPTYGSDWMFPTFVMPLEFNYPHKGTFNLDYRFGDNDGGPVLSNLGLNLQFNFNSGRTYTRVDPVAYAASTDTRIPVEPIGYSQTPWVYLFDLTVDKTVTVGPLDLNVYVTITNLLNTQNEVSVFPSTGTAFDDGALNTDATRNKAIATGRADDYMKLYKWMNILTAGNFSMPREVWLGLRIDI